MDGSRFLVIMGTVYGLMMIPSLFLPGPTIVIGILLFGGMLVTQWLFLYGGEWQSSAGPDQNLGVPIVLALLSLVPITGSILAIQFSDYHIPDWTSVVLAIAAGAVASAATVAVDQVWFRKLPSLPRRARALALVGANLGLALLLSMAGISLTIDNTDPGYGAGLLLVAFAIWAAGVGIAFLWVLPPAIVLLQRRREHATK